MNWWFMASKWLAIGAVAVLAAAATDIAAMDLAFGAVALAVIDALRDLLKQAFGLI